MGGPGSGGHNKKSRREHILHGTFRPDRHGRPDGSDRPQPSPQGRCPSPPRWLDEHARKFWKDHAPRLHELGLLNEANAMIFAAMATCWHDYVQSTLDLHKTGLTYTDAKGREKPNPLIKAADDALREFRRFARDWGLAGPASRARLGIPHDEI